MKYQPTKPKTVLQLGDEGMLTIVMAGAASHFGVSHKVIGQRLRKSPAPNEVTKVAKKQGKPSA
jgi:hypothetical protein